MNDKPFDPNTDERIRFLSEEEIQKSTFMISVVTAPTDESTRFSTAMIEAMHRPNPVLMHEPEQLGSKLMKRIRDECGTFHLTANITVHPDEIEDYELSSGLDLSKRPDVLVSQAPTVKPLRGQTRYTTAIDDAGWFVPAERGPEQEPELKTQLNNCDLRDVLVIGPGSILPPSFTLNNTRAEMIETKNTATLITANESIDDGRARLHKDEEWRREGNNKKWRRPGVEANRKKAAKASKKRNRR